MKRMTSFFLCALMILFLFPIMTVTVPTVAVADAASDRIDLARQILANKNISLWDHNNATTVVWYDEDGNEMNKKPDHADAKQNIIDTSNGIDAKRSHYTDAPEKRKAAPGGRKALSVNMLRAMLELENGFGKYTVSAIAGGSHSNGSKHYAGIAFDVSSLGGKPTKAKGEEIYNYLTQKGYKIAKVNNKESVWENRYHYHIQVNGYKPPDVPEDSIISFDTYAVEDLTEDSIQASVWMSNQQALTISELGIQCGTDKNYTDEATITNNITWSRALLNYKTCDYFGSLSSGRTYYIRYFAVVEGSRYYSDWITATTIKGELSFDTYSIEDVYESDAQISVWLDNPNGKMLSEIGLEAGKSKEVLSKRVVATNVSWTRSLQSYWLSGIIGAYLESGTTYYARYYTKSGDLVCYSDWFVLTTASGGISFDSYSITNISDQDANIAVWLDNPNAWAIDQICLRYGSTAELYSDVLIAEDVEWSRAYLDYRFSQLGQKLDGNTTYYARYIIVADGKTYQSDLFTFKTGDAEIQFEPVSLDTLTRDNIKISAWMSNTKELVLDSIGFQLGNEQAFTTKYEITKDVTWTRAHLSYNILPYCGDLEPNSTYYMQYYVITNGKTYCSDWISFTTLGNVLILPSTLREVEEDAFSGLSMEQIVFPESIERIGARSFSNCENLFFVVIPVASVDIAPNTFSGCTDICINAPSGGTVEAFASANGIIFIEK